jgi:hypothetical protein
VDGPGTDLDACLHGCSTFTYERYMSNMKTWPCIFRGVRVDITLIFMLVIVPFFTVIITFITPRQLVTHVRFMN